MADHRSRPTDFWAVLEEARAEVARWEPWKQKHEADIYYDGYPHQAPRLATTFTPDVAPTTSQK